jgi:succinate-semialdehyde dehydrogenase/glutarate-semialdehyde dehydrogenase
VTYATTNPYTGEKLREYPFLDTGQIPDVIERADAAFQSWRDLPVAQRAQVVRRAGELMLDRKDEFAGLMTLEMGKRISEAHLEVELAANILQYYGDRGPEFLLPTWLTVDVGSAEIVNEPLGVLLGVEPWNYPLYQVVRFAAPNLVVGNTVLLKHASLCPQSALALERLFADAGAPEGVYTNVFLRHSDMPLVMENPAVQGASLTGSEQAGVSVGELSGHNLKKCVLELGGSDPLIVLDAPDMEKTVATAAIGRLFNAGQSCVASKRFILSREVYDPFLAGLACTFEALRPGDPADPATTLAPLSSEQAAKDLTAQVQDAVDKGATVVTGGGRPDRQGAFVDATILTDVRPGMRAYSEELFGPVVPVYGVASDGEAVELANATSFGLGGTVMCSDLQRARSVADRIDSGMVWINQPTSSEPGLPFGGVKRSGFGRELSQLGTYGFTNRKLIRTIPAAE